MMTNAAHAPHVEVLASSGGLLIVKNAKIS